MCFPALILSTWIADVISASQHPWHHKDEQVEPVLHVWAQTCMYEVDQRECKVNIAESVYARRLPFQLSSYPIWRRPCGTESSGWCRAAGGLSCDVTAESDGVFPAVCGSDLSSECSGMCFCSATKPKLNLASTLRGPSSSCLSVCPWLHADRQWDHQLEDQSLSRDPKQEATLITGILLSTVLQTP